MLSCSVSLTTGVPTGTLDTAPPSKVPRVAALGQISKTGGTPHALMQPTLLDHRTSWQIS
eukprot:2684096-Rhodomonas_salina.1